MKRGAGLVVVLIAASMAASGCSEDFDPNDRRLATQDEYSLVTEPCAVEGGRAVQRGELTNLSGRSAGFGVIVRYFDGDVDLGRPQEVSHPEPLDDGEAWAWEVGLDVDTTPADLRCNVIQVVIGDDIDR